VFVRLVRTIDRYEHDGRFEAWLFRIATNLVRDRIRKAQRRGELNSSSNSYEADATNQLANLSDDKAVSPDDQLRLREEVDELQQALDDLPDAEREVICLRHFSGLSFKEVAEAMGTPIGTALARAHRGLARLKEMMTP
jgi:RNA polymerase sigma-70 factor (ECF subfamily)